MVHACLSESEVGGNRPDTSMPKEYIVGLSPVLRDNLLSLKFSQFADFEFGLYPVSNVDFQDFVR